MIPTSVTNSPPAAGLAQNGAAIVVVGGSGGSAVAAAAAAAAASTVTSQQNNYNCIVLGLASLILEGRPIADDEYQLQSQSPSQLTSASVSGRLSPRPSTSRAAINITTNPYALTSGGAARSTYGHATSGSSSSNNHATHQRWTQKLCQLRQVSPAAQSMSVEPELVSLAINDLDRRDFEIVRRVMLNRAGGGGMGNGGGGGGGGTVEQLSSNNSSAGSSTGSGSGSISGALSISVSGSDNILHSLQSLATTCLRGGSVETRPQSLSLGYATPTTAATAATTVSAASLLDYNCSRSTSGLGKGVEMGVGMAGVGVRGVEKGVRAAAATSTATASSGAAGNVNAKVNGTSNGNGNGNSSCAARPKIGPHCDQFLRKMGLAKGGDSNEPEEHFCDMSYVNITCSRWRAHCLKMEAILARRENVCIEVYLGPAGHKILLEQWIISGKEKVPPPTMTLPSLCSAIRSQLYFSQIVAWCDLLRKCDPAVYDSGRVIFGNGSTSSAGDLAGHTSSSSSTSTSTSTSTSSSMPIRRPRLNIFYRIRAHDVGNSGGDGGFSAKANVHNFPHVNIAENFSVAVCVKSLPRFNGGLPPVAPPPAPLVVSKPRALRATPTASTPTGGGGMCAATPTGLGARIAISSGNLQGEGDGTRGGCDELDGHRERQLQKYRKRMQRRDKKRERKPSEQMEAMDEGSDHNMAMTVMTVTPPAAVTPRRSIAMISTGTQTSLSSCQQCGSEKTLLCLNCTTDDGIGSGNVDVDVDDETSVSDMDDMSSSSCSLSSCDLIVGTPRNKAELLLQAIQRTPKNRKLNTTTTATATTKASNDLNAISHTQSQLQSHSNSHSITNSTANQNNNQQQQQPTTTVTLTTTTTTTSGCQVCKRQKTQHNFSNNSSSNNMEQEEPEQSATSTTKLTPNLDRCTLNGQPERCQTPPEMAGAGSGSGASDLLDERIVVQFKTPISHVPLKLQEYQHQQHQHQQQHQQQQQHSTLPHSMTTKVPHQLRLNCGAAALLGDRETPPPMLSPLLRKALPKVNLTTIFCSSSSSAPIAIDNNAMAFSFEPSTSTSHALLTPPEHGNNNNNLSVQKSYSAPTLPNALSISPRFAKQAAFYKRRSRHLSDRSDRSSLGSDEQLSDEDLESGMCSPAGSPLKTRARLVSQFTGRPLLGNLEESLLQKRLLPKIEVAGFRLQLGASGGFCPTQLTIPASSYFYELHGETLSTPYLCEIRLPRKGYFVPRSGTVQATLLNPMGTVVRMFVIPYDMHDMPPLHRTFIRQRILAEELPGTNPCTGILSPTQRELQRQRERELERDQNREPGSPTATSTTSKLGHFISAEQMKRLRYSIHLRFQTSRSGRLSLHTDIRLLISRRTDCDTAAAHAKGLLEAPNELVTDTLMPTEPRYSARQESASKI
ncbi:hypothetical protein ACLKA6_006893 [Drosophila palustris]